MHFRLLVTLIAVGASIAPAIQAQGSRSSKQTDDDVARAIAFERHKEQAAERQARLDARRSRVRDNEANAERSSESISSRKAAKGSRNVSREKARPENRE